jgi:hypothetical protein
MAKKPPKESQQMDYTEQSIKEIKFLFTLPPPVYGNWLTVVPGRAERTVKLVKDIRLVNDFIYVVAQTDEEYQIPVSQVQFMRYSL